MLSNVLRHFGERRHDVSYNDLMRILEQDQVVVEPGDILRLRTGLDQLIMAGNGQPDPAIKHACAVLNGWDPALLQWITDSGVAAIASDYLAIEAVGKPIPAHYQGSSLPLHELCLFKPAVYLCELWHLVPLAHWLHHYNRSRFLLTASPLRLPCASPAPSAPR